MLSSKSEKIAVTDSQGRALFHQETNENPALSFTLCNEKDANGRPAGGRAVGLGLIVQFQKGPIDKVNDRLAPNGTLIETLLLVAKARLEFYQASEFKCAANAKAINYINEALAELDARTQDRIDRGVEGKYQA